MQCNCYFSTNNAKEMLRHLAMNHTHHPIWTDDIKIKKEEKK